jgi:AAA ATPase domain/Adenylate and Guanylate cyclase catalytic domain
MTCEEILDQALAMLQRRGRVTYRALGLQFKLNDDQLEALTDELLYAHPQVVDDAGRGLLWTGTSVGAPPPAAASARAQERAPLSYTPPHLAEHFRVGVNSGEVVAQAIDNNLHLDYSAIGRTVHLAARMEQLATPGRILLTPATLRLVEGLVQVNALGPMPVKGLTAMVEVFELVGASTVRRRLQVGVARGLTRFVGRETELDALCQAMERVGRGQGQLVAVVGEPGVGKSRLLYEFVHSHRPRGWRVLEAASVSYRKATPYFPIVDLLKRYLHIEEGDEPRTVQAKVTGHLLTLDETLQETIPALLVLLDALPADSPFLTLDPPQRRLHILAALKRVLLRESQVQPLLLVVEDLHWIDAETQALLDSLVESLPTAHLLLLVNYRPEYQHGWGGKAYYTQLRLDPLPPASANEVLQALLGDNPSLAPLKPQLITRTEGNPFFLEESVRTLVESGVLVGGPWASARMRIAWSGSPRRRRLWAQPISWMGASPTPWRCSRQRWSRSQRWNEERASCHVVSPWGRRT